MGSGSSGFGAVVVATAGMILGVGYLLGAMLTLLSNGGNGVLLLANSVPVTSVTALLLLLTGGYLGTGHRSGRFFGVVAFGAVAIFGRPSLSSPDAFTVVLASFSLLVALYLLFRNPFSVTERSEVDESESATRLGSTLR